MTSADGQEYLLAGDIGGTKTSLALYDQARGPLFPINRITVQNDSASSLEDLVASFLQKQKIKPAAACFGVAGPVIGNRVRMTNFSWLLDGRVLQKRFNMRSVVLINDLVATAMGAVHLPQNSLLTINTGQPDPVGAIAVIAPGTGLGEAFLVRRGDHLVPYPSEGGHRSFAPGNEQQIRLLRFMTEKQEYVSTEHVCSGKGIPSLYDFLASENDTPANTTRPISFDDHRTRLIIGAALDGQETETVTTDIAGKTIRLFVEILASEAANLALTVLATGGLYIGGGIPPRILPFLDSGTFTSLFRKGVYRDMLSNIPIHIILDPQAALAGAAACGLEQLSSAGGRP